eukprot:s1163_g19.t1
MLKSQSLGSGPEMHAMYRIFVVCPSGCTTAAVIENFSAVSKSITSCHSSGASWASIPGMQRKRPGVPSGEPDCRTQPPSALRF